MSSEVLRREPSPTGGRRWTADLPARPDRVAPQTIGKYHVVRRLGAGGMGVVYLCRQPDLDRLVAVKVLSLGCHATGELLERFAREARLAAQLTHPHIVRVYDTGADGGLPYLVLEYVNGQALDQLIGSPVLSVENALRLTYQMAGALQAAHDQGIVHRDVKPANILIDATGQPRLTDFGLARWLDRVSTLSGGSDVLGTPRYMSPEQALAAPEEIDHRTDIYSLGVVLFEMLTGRPAFDGPNPLAVLRRLIDEGPPDLGKVCPDLPAEVVAICNRAMARQPADRYASAAAFAEAIQGYLLDGRFVGRPIDLLAPLPLPVPARPRSRRLLAIIVLGTVLLATAGVAIALSDRSRTPVAPVPEPAGEIADPGHLSRPAIIARAREQLRTLPDVADGQTVRDRLQSVLEDLTVLLRQHPDDGEGRLLRARAYRHGGECLAAIAELNAVCGRDPANLDAVAERLLATYQVHVLYLGNINDPVLRPNARGAVRADVERLKRDGDQRLQDLARTVEALALFDYVRAGELAERLHSGAAPLAWHADLAMVEADALFHAAEFAYGKETTTEGEEQDQQQRRRTASLRKAVQALRRGLDAHPTHLGLLFLKANAVQRSAVWEGEGEGRDVLLRRQRPAFESAMDRLRRGALRLGCDSMIARAVLLDNFDRRDPALDQLTDALATRSPLSHLPVWKAWLRLQQPSDGALTVEEIDAIVRDLAPALEAPAEDYQPYYVRALLQAHAGRWQEAQRDLRQCRKLGADHLPEIGRPHDYQWWYALAEAGSLGFLHGTIDVIGASPVDVRVRLIEELLRRLADGEIVKAEAVPADEVKALKARAHFRRARCAAEKEDRAGVLAHLRKALAQRQADLTPKQAREDEQLKAWNDDPEFQKLYAEFEPKNGGP